MTPNISATWKCCPASPTAAAHVVPVSIHADRSRRNHYSFAAGYATDTGPRGTLGGRTAASIPTGIASTCWCRLRRSRATASRVATSCRSAIRGRESDIGGTVEQRQLADVTTRTLSLGPSVNESRQQLAARVDRHRHAHSPLSPRPGPTLTGCSSPVWLWPPCPRVISASRSSSIPFLPSCAARTACSARIPTSFSCTCRPERVFNLASGWHLLLRDEVGASLVSRFQRAAEVMRFFAGVTTACAASPTTICRRPSKSSSCVARGYTTSAPPTASA